MNLSDIHSLSDFQRNARDHIRQIEESGQPAILTVNGQAKLVVQDVVSYERLVERAREADALHRLKRGVSDYRAGRFFDAEATLNELEARHFGKPAGKRKK